MSTLVRHVSFILLFSLFFCSLFVIAPTSCSAVNETTVLSGPFCAMEQITATFFLESSNGHDAVLAQKLVLVLAVLAISILVSIVRSGPYTPQRIIQLFLVHFGPYQKRYPVMLPSFP